MRSVKPVSLVIALSCLLLGFEWPQASARLRDELAQASPRERIDLVRRLATFHDDIARDALLSALDDSDPNVRRHAVDAVATAKISHASDKLLVLLSDKDANLRRASALALGKLGLDASRAPLTRARSDADPRVRAAAISALSALPPPHDLTVLISALDDTDADVRVETVRALSLEDDPRVISALLGRTRDQAPEVRRRTLEALCARNDPRARAACFAALEDTSDSVVIEALKGLRNDRGPDAEKAIAALAESERPRVRRAAEHVRLLLSRDDEQARTTQVAPWLFALERTAENDVRDADALLTELEATLPAGEARAAAPLSAFYARAPKHLHARILGLLHGPPSELVSRTVTGALREKEPATRRAALLAVKRLSMRGLDEPLVRALDDPDPEVRKAAIDAIGEVGGPKATRLLIARMLEGRRNGPDLLHALAATLRRSRTEIAEDERNALRGVLLVYAREGEDHAAIAAFMGLGALGDDASVDALVALAPSRTLGQRVAIVRALRTAESPKSIASLRAWLQHEEPPVVANAMAALGELGEAEDVARIEEVGKQGPWPLGPVAAYALATLVDRRKASPRVLCSAAQSDEPVTRRNAQAVLARLADKPCGAVSPPVLGAAARPESAATARRTWTALVREDERTLITYPDSTLDARWPGFVEKRRESAWAQPYRH